MFEAWFWYSPVESRKGEGGAMCLGQRPKTQCASEMKQKFQYVSKGTMYSKAITRISKMISGGLCSENTKGIVLQKEGSKRNLPLKKDAIRFGK
jgi:hypothetical protein